METEDFSEIMADIEAITDEALVNEKVAEIRAYGNIAADIDDYKVVKQA